MRLAGYLLRLVLAGLLYLPLRWALGAERWWLAALVAVMLALFAVFVIKGFAKAAFLLPFRMKGETLRGCAVEIHDIRRTATPAPNPEWDETAEDLASRAWFEIDATFTPLERPTPRALPMWEPGEIQLILPDTNMNPWSDRPTDDDACTVRDLDYFEEGAWVRDDGMKFAGPKRIRFQAGVQPGIARLKWRYYFESPGLVDLPR